MIGGLGAIGVASAGAGLGTTAFFSDSESFENNTLTAGELDLFVHVDYEEEQGSFAEYSTPPGTFINGGVAGANGSGDGVVVPGEPLSVRVVDLKPGDSGEGRFCFSIVNNPAHMWMCGELTANDQNGFNGPELDVLDPDGDSGPDPDGSGQLADAMELTVSYCGPDGEIGEGIVSGTLREVLLSLRAGVPLYGDGDPAAPIANRPAFEGVEEPFVGDEPNVAETCICLEWEVPTTVGNEIQTDSVAFDIEFYAEQERHNDGTNNPCVEFDTVLTTDFGPGIDRNGDGEADSDGNWITARVSAGPTTVIEVALDGDMYGGGTSGFGEWPSNATSYVVEANIDVDNDGLGESPNDDVRLGFGGSDAGARVGGVANSTSGASGPGGYIRRNVGTGGTNDRFDTAAEDVPGVVAIESADQLTYTFVIDWSAPLPALSAAPGEIVVNEVFAGDGGEGVGTPNSSNDGREDIDTVTDPSGALSI